MKMRKTETVMTDKTSEVEHSILIDNYEGLLAKIHENRLLDDTDSQTSRFWYSFYHGFSFIYCNKWV